MAVEFINFNLSQGIEGLVQTPAQAKGLDALPLTQQVLPSNSTFMGSQVDMQNITWLQAGSRWESAVKSFIMPDISSKVLMPAELRNRLKSIRRRTDRLASKEKSTTLRAMVDVLEDDEMLQEMLQNYRTTLVRA